MSFTTIWPEGVIVLEPRPHVVQNRSGPGWKVRYVVHTRHFSSEESLTSLEDWMNTFHGGGMISIEIGKEKINLHQGSLFDQGAELSYVRKAVQALFAGHLINTSVSQKGKLARFDPDLRAALTIVDHLLAVDGSGRQLVGTWPDGQRGSVVYFHVI